MTTPENPLSGYGPTHHRGKAKEIDRRLEQVSYLRDPFADAVSYTPADKTTPLSTQAETGSADREAVAILKALEQQP